MSKIPFNFSTPIENELKYVEQCIQSGATSGDGFYSKKCSQLLEEITRAKSVLLTPSCTASLEMMALLADIKEGDEVIIPSYTFVSTANAFALRGAKIIFAEINDHMNLDETLIEKYITPKTKAICLIHYAGVACEMDTFREICKRKNIFLFEDAAQGVDAFYKGQALGSIGELGAFSFHATKNISAGEGGALLVNDSSLVERATVIREKGTNRSKFLKGEVDKYTWVDIGSSFLLSDINAAFLLGQLEVRSKIKQKRKSISLRYQKNLKDLAQGEVLRFVEPPSYSETNHHICYFHVGSGETRDKLLEFMRQENIGTTSHYVPLHSSPVGKKMGYKESDFKRTEELASTIVRLPLYYSLTDTNVDYISDKIHQFFKEQL